VSGLSRAEREQAAAHEGSMSDLRLGRWQDVLADVTCDALIFDAPYSQETHEGSRTERYDTDDVEGFTPSYGYLTPQDVRSFVESWAPRCHGWMVSVTDDVLAPIWKAEYQAVDRVAFAAVPIVMRGMSVRNLGDGPSSWSVFAMVSRPRGKKWIGSGALPGAYTGPRPTEAGGGRGKPEWLVNALVRDYSRPGDLICDPFAGWGSTLAAAVANNRRAIGAEMDKDAHAEAVRRLNRPLQVDMFGGAA
jgi:hypothetical protein